MYFGMLFRAKWSLAPPHVQSTQGKSRCGYRIFSKVSLGPRQLNFFVEVRLSLAPRNRDRVSNRSSVSLITCARHEDAQASYAFSHHVTGAGQILPLGENAPGSDSRAHSLIDRVTIESNV